MAPPSWKYPPWSAPLQRHQFAFSRYANRWNHHLTLKIAVNKHGFPSCCRGMEWTTTKHRPRRGSITTSCERSSCRTARRALARKWYLGRHEERWKSDELDGVM